MEEPSQIQQEKEAPENVPDAEPENVSEPEPAADAAEAEPQALTDEEAVPADPARLVYGDENLPNKDAFVLMILGDGFTKTEQDKFYAEADKTAKYIMETSPWDEFKDVVKFYAKGVISNESGAKGDKAKNQEEADKDKRDTYFGASFWTYGAQRGLSLSDDGAKKIPALKQQFLPEADYAVVLVNSTTYGGIGGEYCTASLNSESLEMMLHEMGHTIGRLGDEYWPGSGTEYWPNMTQETDPEKIKWARFIGKNGVGIYEYDNGGDGWYRPHENCKMRFLGKQYAFCEVCKEGLRKAFCKSTTQTKLFLRKFTHHGQK